MQENQILSSDTSKNAYLISSTKKKAHLLASDAGKSIERVRNLKYCYVY